MPLNAVPAHKALSHIPWAEIKAPAQVQVPLVNSERTSSVHAARHALADGLPACPVKSHNIMYGLVRTGEIARDHQLPLVVDCVQEPSGTVPIEDR